MKIEFSLFSQSINIVLNHDSVTVLASRLQVCAICKFDKHISQVVLSIVDKNVQADRF